MKQEIKALLEKAADGGYSFIASTADIDRQGDSIDQTGWDLTNFKNNPVMLWAHDYDAPPVAKVLSLNPSDARGMVGSYEFAPAEGNPFAAQLKVLVDEGFVNAVSVGFIPKERNGNIITKSELLEISFVPVPANQNALLLAAKSLMSHGFEKSIACKAVEDFMKGKDVEQLVDAAPAEEVETPAEEPVVEAAAEVVEQKGAVADEVQSEENYEAKWEKLDEFLEVISAFMDVYLDEDTPVEAFQQLVLEVVSLLQGVAADDGADDDDDAEGDGMVVMSSYRKLIGKSMENIDGKKAGAMLLVKVGARHSAATLEQIGLAADHVAQAGAVLTGLLNGATSSEDGNAAGGDEPSDTIDEQQDDELRGIDAARVLLEVRGILREKTAGDQSALSIINRHLAGRGK